MIEGLVGRSTPCGCDDAGAAMDQLPDRDRMIVVVLLQDAHGSPDGVELPHRGWDRDAVIDLEFIEVLGEALGEDGLLGGGGGVTEYLLLTYVVLRSVFSFFLHKVLGAAKYPYHQFHLEVACAPSTALKLRRLSTQISGGHKLLPEK